MLSVLVAGTAIWWAQLYAVSDEAVFRPGDGISLTPILGEVPEVILADGITATATTPPLSFRACFTTPLSQAMLTETYRVYPHPLPPADPVLPCFDAPRLAAALKTGEAIAFLSEHDSAPGVDRVVAVFPDGHAVAWQQPDLKEP